MQDSTLDLASSRNLDRLMLLLSRATRLRKGDECSRGAALAQQYLTSTLISAYTLWRVAVPVANRSPMMLSTPGSVIYDVGSANAIVRRMYEAFVRMHYLFIAPVDDSAERDLRLMLWERHAWRERRKLARLTTGQTQEEDDAIAVLTRAIDASPHAMIARAQSVQRTLGFNGTLKPLAEMAADAGIPEDRWKFVYGVTSSHSHAAGFHIMKQWSMSAHETESAVRGPVSLACPVLAASFEAYCTLVPEAESLLDDVEEVRPLYEFALEVLRTELGGMWR